MRQTSLHSPIQALRIHPLHKLEALHRRILYAGPPDSAAVVHENIDALVLLDREGNHVLDILEVADIDLSCESGAAVVSDLADHGVDG